jgi:hypothetical protein
VSLCESSEKRSGTILTFIPLNLEAIYDFWAVFGVCTPIASPFELSGVRQRPCVQSGGDAHDPGAYRLLLSNAVKRRY